MTAATSTCRPNFCFGGEAEVALLRDLGVVVDEADGAEGEERRTARSRHRDCAGRPRAGWARRMEMMISTPPMVGVPAFFWCDLGPSSRMCWPIWNSRSLRISQGPSTTHRKSAVRLANGARKSRSRKTERPYHGVRAVRIRANRALRRLPLPPKARSRAFST